MVGVSLHISPHTKIMDKQCPSLCPSILVSILSPLSFPHHKPLDLVIVWSCFQKLQRCAFLRGRHCCSHMHSFLWMVHSWGQWYSDTVCITKTTGHLSAPGVGGNPSTHPRAAEMRNHSQIHQHRAQAMLLHHCWNGKLDVAARYSQLIDVLHYTPASSKTVLWWEGRWRETDFPHKTL